MDAPLCLSLPAVSAGEQRWMGKTERFWSVLRRDAVGTVAHVRRDRKPHDLELGHGAEAAQEIDQAMASPVLLA